MNGRLTQLWFATSFRRMSILQGQGIAAVAVGFAALARWAASPLLGTDVSFIMAVPAVLLATFFGGPLAGLTTVIAGSAIDIFIANSGGHAAIVRATPRLVVWLSSAGVVMLITVELRAILEKLRVRETELLAASDRLQLLIHELEHRGKNALTIVQALSNDVARSASSIAEYRRELGGRLVALAHSYEGLTKSASSPVEVAALVRDVLKPFGSQIKITAGPDCSVAPAASLPLSLALHELATNATKYGALSQPGGEVTIGWTLQHDRDLEVEWRESGGPRPEAITKEGFGSTLLRKVFQAAPGGAFKATWRPEGMMFSLSMQAVAGDLAAS